MMRPGRPRHLHTVEEPTSVVPTVSICLEGDEVVCYLDSLEPAIAVTMILQALITLGMPGRVVDD